ncbi:hypothetical protein CD170_00655, partial [Staphylococcus aureus]
FYIQNQKSGQMKSKKLFPSVRFIIEPTIITKRLLAPLKKMMLASAFLYYILFSKILTPS